MLPPRGSYCFLGKSLDMMNHQQSNLHGMCKPPGLGLDFGGIQTFLPRHGTDYARTGFEIGVPGRKRQHPLSFEMFHKHPVFPPSQHLVHVVLVQMKDDLTKQASVGSTTCFLDCRFKTLATSGMKLERGWRKRRATQRVKGAKRKNYEQRANLFWTSV